MAAQTPNPKYAQMHDDDEHNHASPATRWIKVGLALLVVGCVATALVGHIANKSQSFATAAHSPTKLRERSFDTYEVVKEFTGSTVEYGGYGHPSGGHFSATLQHLPAGSTSSTFLLDHRFQFIVEGAIHITDGTGQKFHGRAGDYFFLPYGSNVTLYTPEKAITYVSIADQMPPILPEQVPTLQPDAYRTWVKESASTTQIKHFTQIKQMQEKVFGDVDHLYFSAIGCWKWNAKQLRANAWVKHNHSLRSPNWNFCSGVFHLLAGPPSFTSYTYKNHEELDFIIDGEFHVTDGDGEKLVLKRGDLVHNPRHKDVLYQTPRSGAFLSTSLSPVDDFFPTI